MERQLKERLTGGIILVALLVLLVPELLSGPSGASKPEAPAPGQAPLRSYTVDINQPSAPPEPALPANAAAASPASEPEPQPRDEAPAAPETGPVSAPPPPVPVVPSQPQPAPHPHAVPRPHAEPRAHAESPARHAEPAKAAADRSAGAKATAAHAAAAHPKTGGEWTVQVGVFSSRANAQHLATELEHKGIAVKVAEIGSAAHPRYRVRAGSAPDHAAALRLLARVHAAGQGQATLVAP